MSKIKSDGWNWIAFIFGPLWYLYNGLILKGLILLIISIITLGFGIPLVLIYSGINGNSALYEKTLKKKGQIDLTKL